MKPLWLCCDIVKLSEYGSGYIAFFSLTKLCFWLCMLFIGFNIPKIIRNTRGTNCLQSDDPNYDFAKTIKQNCVKDWIATHSIANWGYSIDYVEKYIMLGYFALFYIVLTFYYPYLAKLGEEIDKESNVPSDWTVQVAICLI